MIFYEYFKKRYIRQDQKVRISKLQGKMFQHSFVTKFLQNIISRYDNSNTK